MTQRPAQEMVPVFHQMFALANQDMWAKNAKILIVMERIQVTQQLAQVMDNVWAQTNVFAQNNTEEMIAVTSNVLELLVMTQKFAPDSVHVSVTTIVLAFQIISPRIVH